MIMRTSSSPDTPVAKTWLANLLRPAPDSAAAENLRRDRSPWLDAVHLLWTGWVFVTPLLGGPGYTPRWFIITAISYPIFVGLFLGTIFASRRHAYWLSLAMIAMGIGLMYWYSSAITYFIFGCVMQGSCAPNAFLRYVRRLLLLVLLFCAVGMWIGYPWQLLVWTSLMTIIVSLVINIENSGRQKDAALHLSQEEVRRLAATAERERIGRDLHDLLGHSLSLITLKLELTRRLLDRDDARARQELADAEAVARQALGEVRSAVTGFRASDLAGELAAARLMLECIQIHLDHDPLPSLPLDSERVLALVLREAATNIARHSGARRASVRFGKQPKRLWMWVEDDGRGGVMDEGNGLRGMRERLAALGGQLRIERSDRRGTRLAIDVPLPEAAPLPAPPVQQTAQELA